MNFKIWKSYTKFNKNDYWNDLDFYKIYYNNHYKEKYIWLLSFTRREYDQHTYADWCFGYYPDNLQASLDKVIEWDVNYGIEKYIFNEKGYDIYTDGDLVKSNPEVCFNEANKMLNCIKNQECIYLPFSEITIDTPVGYYFG